MNTNWGELSFYKEHIKQLMLLNTNFKRNNMELIESRDQIQIEVQCKSKSCILNGTIDEFKKFLIENSYRFNTTISLNDSNFDNVKSFRIECENKSDTDVVSIDNLNEMILHLYYQHDKSVELECLKTESDDDSVSAFYHWQLPNTCFAELWENLIYELGLKTKLVNFAHTALTFSQHAINQNVISSNRMILLYGPPGTGKTSLCRALAQKLAIRSKFSHTHLIEIISHSLFSKWFSESGKLVMSLFDKIREIIADPKSLVILQIDEIESLAYARTGMSSQEPRDAIRVVNALLTQLDTLKDKPNVFILATSNMAQTIDLAFLDRADIRMHIGLPNLDAISQIYQSIFLELVRVNILEDYDKELMKEMLQPLLELSVGLSGRVLRKIPFLAHSTCMTYISNTQDETLHKIAFPTFIKHMVRAIESYQQENTIKPEKTWENTL